MRRPRGLSPLARSLGRPLAAAIVKRLIIWAACSAIALSLGAVGCSLFGWTRAVQVGLLLTLVSLLPAFVFWPPAPATLWSRLRYLDEGSVFEAYLEAPPGPARSLLEKLAIAKAEALALRRQPRERLPWDTAPLLIAAVCVVAAVELGSLAVSGRGLSLLSGSTTQAPSVAVRVEEGGFAAFQAEDPAAERLHRELSLDMGRPGTELPSEGPSLGGHSPQMAAGADARGGGGEGGDLGGAEGQTPVAKQDSARGAELPVATGPGRATQPAPQRREAEAQNSLPSGEGSGKGDRAAGTSTRSASPIGQGASEGQSSPASGGSRPAPAARGTQGFDRTGNTGIPSPLLEYRSRLASVFAARTGRQLGPNDLLDLGALREYERRYFGSFELGVDLGVAEDPYLAMLKRRWDEVRGGSR